MSEALGKAFAECGTRQRTHGKKLIGKVLFAECPGDTRQRKAAVIAPVPLTVTLPSANPAGTRQRFFIFFKKNSLPSANPSDTRQRVFIFYFYKISLPSANLQALGKDFLFFILSFFAECPLSGTRQSLNFF